MQRTYTYLAANRYIITSLGLTICSLALLSRVHGPYFSGKYLVAEDGWQFINEGHTLGLRSLFVPRAGYLHVYPRIIELVARLFDFKHQPEFLLAGGLLASGILSAVIVTRAVNLGVSLFAALALVALVALQPNDGDVLFNIVNAQWILGPALTIYLLASPADNKPSISEYIMIAVLSLTGLFSILVAPILVLRGVIHRNTIKKTIGMYLIVVMCAGIQLLMLYEDPRGAINALDHDYATWITTFLSFLSFGVDNWWGLAAVGLFWAAFAFVLSRPLQDRAPKGMARREVSWMLLAAALIDIGITFTPSANPLPVSVWGSWGGGYRYTWAPYTLLFASAVIASTDFKRIQYVLLAIIAVICFSHPHSMPTGDNNLRFKSFAHFAKFHPVSIPTNPQGEGFKSQHVNGIPSDAASRKQPVIQNYPVGPGAFTSSGMTLEQTGESLNIAATTDNPTLLFNKPISCPGASDIGLEIEMIRKKDGWVTIAWAPSSKRFTEENTLKYYATGNIAQFAFPNIPGGVYLRLEPLEEGSATISRITIYCLMK
jgi:hypothetical protein